MASGECCFHDSEEKGFYHKRPILICGFNRIHFRAIHNLNVWSLTVGWNCMAVHLTIGK